MQTQKIINKALYPDSPELQLDQETVQDIIRKTNASKKIEAITRMSKERQLIIAGLQADIVGQDEACYEIADLVETGMLNTFHRNGPLGVGFLAGPTGVGKTQIARSLAKLFLGNEKHFTKIPCENLQESHTTRKLFGAPPSYIGYGKSTSISPEVVFKHYETAKKRKKLHPLIKNIPNFSILLFDEIEKAHPKVIRSLLGLLEDGEITFDKGKIATYENTLILFTSNIGQSYASKKTIGFGQNQENAEKGQEENKDFEEEFKAAFPPEFIGRLGLVHQLKHIDKENCKKIIGKRIDLIGKSLKQYYVEGNLYLNISDSVKDYLIEKGYSREYGARPMPRVIEKYISKSLGKIIKNNEDITVRKNPTIVHFDIDKNTNEIFGEIYKQEVVPENWIIDEDYEQDYSKNKISTVNLIGKILEVSDLIRLGYEQLADEYSLEDNEINILQGIDSTMVKGILEQMELDGNDGLNIYNNADIFGNIKPRGLFKLITNQGEDLYSKGNYSKEMFIIHMIVKSHICVHGLIVQGIIEDEILSEDQNRTVIRFAIKAGLKIWNKH